MGNALLFTACLLGAAVLGGFIGSCCAKKREDQPDHERRIAELEDRLDALADHCMEELKKVKDRAGSLEDEAVDFAERLYDCELLIGVTPEDGLLNRVAKLEDAERTHEQDAVIVNGWAEKIKALNGRIETFENSMTLEITGLREEMELQNGH